MDFLLADCLPFLSDHLTVKDLIRLESVSKVLYETIHHDGNLFRRAICAEVGYDKNYSLTVPVKKFEDEEESKKKRYSAQSYPARCCFHAKLKHDGIVVEDLTADKIREMGKSMARMRDNLQKGAPRSNKDGEGKRRDGWWDQWRADGYLGLRGGYIYLDFKIVCGFVLVFSVREMHEYKHQYGYYHYHGFLDEVNQRFKYALERKTIRLRSNDDIPYAYVPYDFYQDGLDGYESPDEITEFIAENSEEDAVREEWERLNLRRRMLDIWERGNFTFTEGRKEIKWLRDSSDTIFAITMGRQFLRRIVPNPEPKWSPTMLQKLTDDQAAIGKKFFAPHVWARGRTVDNANNMLGIHLELAEYQAIQESLDTVQE